MKIRDKSLVFFLQKKILWNCRVEFLNDFTGCPKKFWAENSSKILKYSESKKKKKVKVCLRSIWRIFDRE